MEYKIPKIPSGSSVVYWIHRPCHTDITTQGYVGITKNPVDRWAEHRRKAKANGKATIYRAMNKHPDVQYKVVLIGDRQYCEQMEMALRPYPNTGWNIAIGGEDSTKQATIKSQQAYLSKRIQKADYYWHKAEMALLKSLYRQKKAEDKRKLKELSIAHGKDRKLDIRNKYNRTGISWYPKYDLWRAQICYNYKPITLGYYADIDEATNAYAYAKQMINKVRQGAMPPELLKTALKASPPA